MKAYIFAHEEKGLFLSYRLSHPSWDGILFDAEEVKNKLLGQVDERSILYLKSLGYSFSNAEKICSFLLSCYEPTSEKLNYLSAIKKELQLKGWIKTYPYFSKYLQSLEIYVTPLALTKELKRILEKYEITYQNIDIPKKQKNRPLYENDTLEQEIALLFTLIAKIYKKEGTYKNIKILSRNEEAMKELRRQNVFNQFPLGFSHSGTYKQKEEYNLFFENLKTLSITEALKQLNEEDGFLFLKPYFLLKDSFSEDEIKAYFQYLIKKIRKECDEGIEIISSKYLPKKDETLFVLSFNASIFPFFYADDSYPSDAMNLELGLLTSTEKNEMELQYFDELYHSEGNVLFMKHKKEGGLKRSSSFFEMHYSFEIIKRNPDLITKKAYQYFLCTQEDLSRLYGKRNPYSYLLKEENIPYLNYSHSFHDSEIFQSTLPLYLTYSSYNVYASCPFKYLLTYRWKLEDNEETLALKIGNLFHKVLEDRLKGNFFTIEDYFEKYSYDKKEQFFLRNLFYQIEAVYSFHEHFFEDSSFDERYPELFGITYCLDDTTFLTGRIDLLLKDTKNHSIALVDYKTGAYRFHKDYIPYGKDMQLPIYLILAKENFAEDEISGLYIAPILSKEYKETLDEKCFSLIGITRKEKELRHALDSEEKYIASLKTNKDGTLSKNASVMDKEEIQNLMEEAKNKIKEDAKKIHAGDFSIAPKMINEVSECSLCPYHDVCFVNPSDYVRILIQKKEEKQ